MLLTTLAKNTLALALLGTLTAAQAQTPVDIGLRAKGDAVEVVVRPGAAFSGIVSSVVFTIRWERSAGVSLGDIVQEGAAANYIPVQRSGEVREVGGYDYQVFAGFGTRPMHTLNTAWTASKEYVIATIPVQGDASFELVNDVWTNEATNNADFYLSLGGVDLTGIIYKGLVEASGSGNVQIQPNPNNGMFNVAVEIAGPVDLNVEITNALGQNVFSQELNQFNGTYRRDMDISNLSSGVYLLKIARGENVSTHKIVYNK